MPNLPEGLLDDVKGYLGITWQDEVTDRKVIGYINRGMARLQKIAGAPLDFEKEDQPRMLLFDYCRYANSQALEVFEKNFQSELLDLNLYYQATTIWELEVISKAGIEPGKTTVTVLPRLTDGNSYMCKSGFEITVPALFDECGEAEGFFAWDGIAEIPAATGNTVLIVETDKSGSAIKAGVALAIVG